MSNVYYFMEFTYFILQILKVYNVNCTSKSYVVGGEYTFIVCTFTSQDDKINR